MRVIADLQARLARVISTKASPSSQGHNTGRNAENGTAASGAQVGNSQLVPHPLFVNKAWSNIEMDSLDVVDGLDMVLDEELARVRSQVQDASPRNPNREDPPLGFYKPRSSWRKPFIFSNIV
jgi:hypothetical protein